MSLEILRAVIGIDCQIGGVSRYTKLDNLLQGDNIAGDFARRGIKGSRDRLQGQKVKVEKID